MLLRDILIWISALFALNVSCHVQEWTSGHEGATDPSRTAVQLELQHVASQIEQQGFVAQDHFWTMNMQELNAASQEMAHAHFVAMSDIQRLMDANPIPNQNRGGRYVVAPVDERSAFATQTAAQAMRGRNGYLVAALYPHERPAYKGILWAQTGMDINTLLARARLSIERIPMPAPAIMH